MDEKRSMLDYFSSDFIREQKIISVNNKNRLFSRKNKVYELEVECSDYKCSYIFKHFEGKGHKQRMARETYFYRMLKKIGFKIPDIFYQGESWLVLENMGGFSLLDYIVSRENQAGTVPSGLTYPPVFYACSYMGDFNRSLYYVTGKSYILGDVNFRNFLLCADGVYRVDLEDCRQGRAEEDLGRFIAFFLTYQPAYTEWKQSQCRLIKEYCTENLNMDMGLVESEIERELVRMKKRRKSN